MSHERELPSNLRESQTVAIWASGRNVAEIGVDLDYIPNRYPSLILKAVGFPGSQIGQASRGSVCWRLMFCLGQPVFFQPLGKPLLG